jgi:ATP-dependent Lon protease
MTQKNSNAMTTSVRSKKSDNKTTGKKASNKKNDGRNRRLSKRDPDSESEEEEEWESEESETSSSEDEPVRKNKKSNKKRVIKDEDSESEEEVEVEEDEKFDKKQYKKFLASLFPSKYSKKAAAASDEDSEKDKPKKKSSSNSKKHNKKHIQESESEEEDDDYDDEDEDYYDDDEDDEDTDEDDEEDEDEHEDEDNKQNNKINIILSVSGNEDDDYDNYFGHSEDDEDEDDECNTDDEETFMKEKYEKVIPPADETETEKSNDSDSKDSDNNKKKSSSEKKSKKKSVVAKKSKKDKVETESVVDVESEYIELLELKKDLTKKLHKNPKSKILKKAIAECCDDINKLVKDARKNNTKEYRKLIIGEKKQPNEMNYFKTKLSNAEQLKVMRELKEVNEFMGVDKPYRLALLESTIPSKLKANAMQKINMLRSMDTCDPEYFKIKNWVDTFMRIPFCKYSNLSVSISDGIDKCHDFMSNAKDVLDKCVYGLDDAKLQILQMVGQWISNPDAMGTAIAIKGPPGTGKTTLVKDGISKILGREFIFIPLGGAGDASYLEGHSYTYEGSTWGKIVQSLIDCKCMNPVFYFDELDKISDTPKGEEITGILTHMTDTTQNSQFHDKYFSDVDFDLSKCLFIFSYNDESKVNPILKDRMYRIQTKGYDAKEKIVIANNYMLPKIREQVNFKSEDIVIPDDTIKYIVSSQHLTHNEDGVRNMKRCLEIIHTKLNLFRLIRPEENMFAKDIDISVQFPFTVDTKAVDKLIKNEEKQSQSLLSMYI